MQKQYDRGDIEKLLEIMAALRHPVTGCPWDLEQDFDTIAPYTIEEAYEVADCIARDAPDELPDELGDLLFQVVFHAQMGADRNLFGFADVVESICAKMIRRHPHVFDEQGGPSGADEAPSRAEVAQSWDRIKREERPAGESLMAGIALALPALTRARKLGKRAASVGFDWPDAEGVRAKIAEELAELDAAIAAGSQEAVEAECGDLLFSVVNYCRHLGVDAERALRGANDRFARRFERVEAGVRAAGGDWRAFDIDALEALWAEAKAGEKA
ncbi:MAG TPA: nucleoside triphosphate pyrophosphohydrolase [Gammaproteobacteria bacterium]|nr:nucleoside triphosphate pyrophosphohydrolase [Gammaproteobacteria bacterium]